MRPLTGRTSSGLREPPAGPADEDVISLTNVGFAYPDGLRAVGQVTMSVRRGEFLSVIGPSGCGKSTLLRMLGGLRKETWGRIDRAPRSRDRHPCSMVFQEDTLLPWLKARDNVSLHFKLHGRTSTDRAYVREHVQRLLEMVHLAEFADAYPAKLSGGMRRRIAVLSAVAPLPELLLLDEPFSALDEPTRIGVHRDIYQLIREFGMSTILVTHDLAEAITLSDRILLLSRAPSRVVEEYTIPFGHDRNIMDLRSTPEFLELYGRIWSDLERQILGSKAHEQTT